MQRRQRHFRLVALSFTTHTKAVKFTMVLLSAFCITGDRSALMAPLKPPLATVRTRCQKVSVMYYEFTMMTFILTLCCRRNIRLWHRFFILRESCAFVVATCASPKRWTRAMGTRTGLRRGPIWPSLIHINYFLSSLNSTARVGDSDIELGCKQHGAVGSARGPYRNR